MPQIRVSGTRLGQATNHRLLSAGAEKLPEGGEEVRQINRQKHQAALILQEEQGV